MNNTLILRGAPSLARDTRLVFALLEGLHGGLLEIRLPDGTSPPVRRRASTASRCRCTTRRCSAPVLARGDIGLAEAYLDGQWDSPDVTALLHAAGEESRRAQARGLRLVARAAGRTPAPLAEPQQPRRQQAQHHGALRPRQRLLPPVARRDDELFERDLYRRRRPARRPSAPSTAASCAACGAQPGQRVLEIGCGWGGFAEMAVDAGLQVTGLTLSPAQLEWAQRRVCPPGTADLRLQDYRDNTRAIRPHRLDRDVRGGRRALVAELLPDRRPRAEARRPRRGPEHHHPRRPVRRLPARHRLHPAVRLPRRHAALARGLPHGRGETGAGGAGRVRLRPRLCAHAGRVAPRLRGQLAADRAARLRRALPPPVAALPLLLRGRLPGRQHRCRPVRTRRIAEAAAPCCSRSPPGRWPAWRCEAPIAGLRRWGSGEFRRFGFLVYEATLWAGDDPLRPPLALHLDYKRNIAGTAIAEASVKEMRRTASPTRRGSRDWGEQHGAHLSRCAARRPHRRPPSCPRARVFIASDRLLGRIDDPDFAQAFFAIWLDPRTSAPELRAALLQAPTELTVSTMSNARMLSYGLLGLPLAFAALPIYVHVPRFYAETAGMELALLGAILLGARLLDAGIDPWLGWLADRVPRPTMVARRAAALRRRLRRACSIRPAPMPHPGCSARWRSPTSASRRPPSPTRPGAPTSGRPRGCARGSPPRARASACSAWCWPPPCRRCWPRTSSPASSACRWVLPPAAAGRGRDHLHAASARASRRYRQPKRQPLVVRQPATRLADRGLPPPAAGLRRQRHRRRAAGHAVPVLRRRRAATGSGQRPAAGALLRRRRGLAAALGEARRRATAASPPGSPPCCCPSPPSPAPASSAAATCGRSPAICLASGVALGADLALPAAIAADIGERHAPGRRLLRRVELRRQAQPGAGRRPVAAAAGARSATCPATPQGLPALVFAYALLPLAFKALAACCSGAGAQPWRSKDENHARCLSPLASPAAQRPASNSTAPNNRRST